MRTRACLATLLLAAAGLVADIGPAKAQEKDAVTEMARRRFQEGVKFFDQKKFEEARAAFLQAYALKHHPAVLLNLAQSEIRSGHPSKPRDTSAAICARARIPRPRSAPKRRKVWPRRGPSSDASTSPPQRARR